jgi:hypothetical protein
MNRLMILILCVAGCSPATDQPATNQTDKPTVQEKPAEVPSLAGEWNVTASNGKPLTQVFPMTASVSRDQLTVHSECVSFAWAYTQDRNIVSFKPGAVRHCERNQTQNENEAQRAIGGANIALFLQEGREVQLSGNGGTVTLTRR